MTKSERAEVQSSLKSVAIEVSIIPPAIILAWAAFFELLGSLTGLSGNQLALDFIQEAASPVAILQAKTLMLIGVISVLAFIAGHFRLEALICHVGARISAEALRLTRTWSLMLTGVRILIGMPTTSVLPNCRQDGAPRISAGFEAGESPQLE